MDANAVVLAEETFNVLEAFDSIDCLKAVLLDNTIKILNVKQALLLLWKRSVIKNYVQLAVHYDSELFLTMLMVQDDCFYRSTRTIFHK